MSKYTNEYLREHVRYGYKGLRGKTWWDTWGEEGTYAFDGAVPLDVAISLIDYPIQEQVIPCPCGECGQSRKELVHGVTGHYLGTHNEGWKLHSPKEWLLDGPAKILDDSVNIGSVGVLGYGQVVWVQIEMSDSAREAMGTAFRPYMLCYTAMDGSMSTGFQWASKISICDNTFYGNMSERTKKHRTRHTRNSELKVLDIRSALGIMFETADTIETEMRALMELEVSSRQFSQYLDLAHPIPERRDMGKRKDGQPKEDKTHNNAVRLQDTLTDLYTGSNKSEIDDKFRAMVAPYEGTAWGVLMMENTWTHHLQGIKGDARGERNLMADIKGQFADVDRTTMSRLGQVLDGKQAKHLELVAA